MKSCPTCKALYPTEYSVCPRDGAELHSATQIAEGAVLRGKYKILGLLGRGGMGSVYKARHLAFGELYALKLVSAQLAEDPGFLDRFRSEAVVMRKLSHPNAVGVHDFDQTEDGRPFIVMEYVEGEPLDKVLAATGALPPRRALRLASQVCAALAAAHKLGIIHRDIKPANILLARPPQGAEIAKVLDFGVAKVKEQSTLLATTASLTGTGFVVGTPAYMSPEQARATPGAQLDGRADLYSLGVVLYHMLTGRLPFESDTPMTVMMAHIQTPAPDPRSLRADLPADMAGIVLRALEKEPGARFANAAAMKEALDALLEDRTIRLTPPPAPTAATRLPGATTKAAPSPVPAALAPTRRSATPVPAGPPEERTRAPLWWKVIMGTVVVLVVLLFGQRFAQRFFPSEPANSEPATTQTTEPAPTQTSPLPASSFPVTQPPLRRETPSTTHTQPQATFPTAPPQQNQSVPFQLTEPEEPRINPRVASLLKEASRAGEQKDYARALRLLRRAHEIDPDDATVNQALERAQRELRVLLAQAFTAARQGNYDDALRIIDRVLEVDPDNQEAKRGRERLLELKQGRRPRRFRRD